MHYHNNDVLLNDSRVALGRLPKPLILSDCFVGECFCFGRGRSDIEGGEPFIAFNCPKKGSNVIQDSPQLGKSSSKGGFFSFNGVLLFRFERICSKIQ
jgi:hypothetical protein